MNADFSSHRPLVMGTRWMIVSGHPLASQAGASILEQGGNVVDAAIAANAVLAVVQPHMCGLGGDLFALLYLSRTGRLTCLNASGRSPFLATPKSLRESGFDAIPTRGLLSATVPGAVDGWTELHEKYGSLDFQRLLQRAVDLADEGFPVYGELSRAIAEHAPLLKESASAREVFFPDGREPRPGERLVQKELALSLRKIAAEGREVFYRGELAKKLVACCQKEGGFFIPRDLEEHSSTWCEPLRSDYRGFTLATAPPNSQGIAWLMQANMLENCDLALPGHNGSGYIHLFVEAKKLAFADRDRYLCDPAFHHIPVTELLHKEQARRRLQHISAERAATAVPPSEFQSLGEDTVYLAAVDRDGNAISLIQSLYEPFGSGVMVPGTGILLQNRGRDFRLDPDHPNVLAPHKRPYHTLTPAMILIHGSPFIVLGSPGADGQTQTLMQLTANLLDFSADPQEAVEAPRWRSNPDHSLLVESRFDPQTVRELEAKGHRVIPGAAYDRRCGGAQAILVNKNGILAAGADPRRQAYAIGR